MQWQVSRNGELDLHEVSRLTVVLEVSLATRSREARLAVTAAIRSACMAGMQECICVGAVIGVTSKRSAGFWLQRKSRALRAIERRQPPVIGVD